MTSIKLDKGVRSIFFIFLKSVVCAAVIPVLPRQKIRRKLSNLKKKIFEESAAKAKMEFQFIVFRKMITKMKDG